MLSRTEVSRMTRAAIRDFVIGLSVFIGLFLVLGSDPSGAGLFDTAWFSQTIHTATEPHLSGPMAIDAGEYARSLAAQHQVYVSPFSQLGGQRAFVMLGLAVAFAAAFAFNLGLWRHLVRTPARTPRRFRR